MKRKTHVDALQTLTSTRWMKPNRRRWKARRRPDPLEVYVTETIEELEELNYPISTTLDEAETGNRPWREWR